MSFREPEGQIARWLERLQEYDFEVEHRPGESHCNADAMSPKPMRFHGDCPSCGQTGPLQTRVSTLAHGHAKEEVNLGNPWSANAISQAQRKDPDTGPVLEQYLREREKPSMHELQSLSRTSIQERCGLSVNLWRLWIVYFVFALRRVVHHRNIVLLCQGVLSSQHSKNVMML